MSSIGVYVIVDKLSEKVIHVFYAPNYKFAFRKFAEFLDTLKGRSKPDDFGIINVGYVDDVPETFDEVNEYVKDSGIGITYGEEAIKFVNDMDKEEESK